LSRNGSAALATSSACSRGTTITPSLEKIETTSEQIFPEDLLNRLRDLEQE